MEDQDKTKEQLTAKVAELRQRVAELEQASQKKDAETARHKSGFQRWESALQESERRYKTLLYNLPERVFYKGRDSVYVSCNHNYAADFGLTPEQMIGKNDYDFYPPELAEKYRADDRRIMDLGTTEEIEERYCTSAGKECVVRTVKAAVKDEHNSVIGILGIFSDITERKLAEEALKRERGALRHMLHASDHERQVIAYDIHDGLAQYIAGALMQFDTHERLQTSQPKQAADAYQAAMTMLRQSHFEARRLISGVRPPILDESGVVAAIAHLVHEPRGRKAPSVEFHYKVDFDRLEGVEENAIYRIAQEGLANACQHSKSKKAKVSLVQRDDRVQIEVRDWGIGFDPKHVREGCYGLAGIRQRARVLGGKCSIRSKAGKGTRITVELPVVARE